MKFLTDENLAKLVVASLRSRGFYVKDVKEENLEGSSDPSLVELANKENLIIVTLDRDFAKLFDEGVIKTGVIFIPHKKHKSKQITDRLTRLYSIKASEGTKSQYNLKS